MSFFLFSQLTFASPQASLSLESHLRQESNSYSFGESIVRGRLFLTEDSFQSDIWIEVAKNDPFSNSTWMIAPQRLVWQQTGFSIGYQTQRWGMLDVLETSDLVSPKEMRWGPNIPPELKRRASPSIQYTKDIGQLSVQSAFILGPALNSFSLTGNRWSILPPETIEELWSEAKQWSGSSLDESYWPPIITELERIEANPIQLMPKSDALPLDFTVMLNRVTTKYSFGLGSGWVRSRMPGINIDPVIKSFIDSERYPPILNFSETLESIESPVTYQIVHSPILSAWYGQLFGRWNTRFEASYQHNTPVQRDLMTSTTASKSSYGVGIDTPIGQSIFVASEVRLTTIASSEPSLWLQSPLMVDSALIAQGFHRQGRLRWTATAVGIFPYSEYLLQSKFGWRWRNNWQINLGSNQFFGTPPEDFSDRIRYNGGWIGYWASNDDLYFQIQWIQ